MKAWSRCTATLIFLLTSGCADGEKLIQEHDQGGVVVYPYKGDQGPLLSSFRNDALSLMKEKCGGPYTIVKEGEAKGRARMASPVDGAQEMVQERRWGIQFQCK